MGVNYMINTVTIPIIPSNQLTLDRPPSSTPPTSGDHGLQVHLQTHPITASKSISKSIQSQCWSSSPSPLDLSLQIQHQIRIIKALKCLSTLSPSIPQSVSLNSASLRLMVYVQTSFNYGLLMHLSVHFVTIICCTSNCSITTCCLSRYTVCRWMAV